MQYEKLADDPKFRTTVDLEVIVGHTGDPKYGQQTAVKKATENHFTIFPRTVMDSHNLMSKANGVKGAYHPFERGSSPGRDSHVRQVGPDRQQATVRNRRTIRVGTWNVRTLYQIGKLENVKQEMMRLDINVLGLNETRWLDSGDFMIDDFKMIYAGGEKHERGVGLLMDSDISKCVQGYWAVSDRVLLVKVQGNPFNISIVVVYAPTADSTEEEIDAFYEDLEKVKSRCKSNEIHIIMGDMNAKVGCGADGKTVGQYGIGVRNDRGDRWVQWCESNDMVIMNTFFKEHPRRVYTWKSPGDSSRNQIDYITINDRFKRAVKHAKTYPGADCGSDHIPVVAKIQCKLKKLKKGKKIQKLDYEKLYNPEIRMNYSVHVENRFETLIDEGEEITWDSMRNILIETAEVYCPKKEKINRKKWMTEDILAMMRSRQKVRNRQGSEYKEIDKNIKLKCRVAKEKWLNEQCEEIESQLGNDHNVYKRINEISGRKLRCSNSGCIKAKDGNMLTEKEEVLNRWVEYIGDLFHDVRNTVPVFTDTLEGPKILKSEVQEAIRKIRRNKAAGPDGIVVEMIDALQEYGVDILTNVINKIYEDGKFPEDLRKSIFIALPKKPGAVDCDQHRTISLMSHVTKIILKILLQRARSRIAPEIGIEQFGFVEDAGTRNAIFVLRMITERAVEMQKDVFMCFIDYSKAFDKVRHDDLFVDLNKLDLHGKDIRLLQSLYWNQSACMRVKGECSDYTNIERGVRQGCVMSPDLFNYYSELILREIKNEKGVRIGGHNITNIRYADDTVLLAESAEDLQRLLDIVVTESERKGLSLNCKKTECMVISKRLVCPKCPLLVKNQQIVQVSSFNYLGSIITEDARCTKEIKRRIVLAKSAFSKLDNILRNGTLSMRTRLRVLNCYVYPVLLYGSEAWSITTDMRKRLESCELWFLRKMMRIPWTEKVSNDRVLERAAVDRELLCGIRIKQMRFLGHVLRKDGMECVVLTGKIEGKRSRGRRRVSWLRNLKDWLETRGVNYQEIELLRKAKNRELWHTMIAYVLGYGT